MRKLKYPLYKINMRKIKRQALQLLRFIFRPKTLNVVTLTLFIADYIFFKMLGDHFEEKSALLSTIFTVGEIYFTIGYTWLLFSLLKNVKWYKSVSWLFTLSIITFLIYTRFSEPYGDLRTFVSLISFVAVVAFLAAIILGIKHIIGYFTRKSKDEFTIRQIKHNARFINFRQRVTKQNVALTVRFLIFAALIIGLIYTINRINTLQSQLTKVEAKLGGPAKLNCNEKSSIEKVRQSVVRIVGGEAEGSGFAIKDGGVILTNFHVIEFEPSPKVILPDNSFQTAEILMANKNADLAIIKINKNLPVISWGDPKELAPAEELLAIGFPLGGQLSGEASVNKGSLSGRRRSKDVGVEYLQTDTTLTPGVSGGPMINICGEVEAINTAGLSGLGLGISADSIKQKWLEMSTADDSLKDIKKITFDDTTSAEFAVATFYNYLKVRKLEKAFEILSDNFKQGHSFDYWKQGYQTLLDTSVIKIEEDKTTKDRVNIKLSTKDMVEGEIVYKYFEGYWDVKNVNGKWRLWAPKVKEVVDPDYLWFYE